MEALYFLVACLVICLLVLLGNRWARKVLREEHGHVPPPEPTRYNYRRRGRGMRSGTSSVPRGARPRLGARRGRGRRRR